MTNNDNKPKWKETQEIRNPKAFYKSKEEWHAINNGQDFCHLCQKPVLEADGMNGADGRLIHEECYEPGDPDNY